MNPGKHLRMGSIFRPEDGRSVIVAVDHGGIAGPIPGIVKPPLLMRSCVLGGADAVLTTRGFLKASIRELAPSTAVILRLTGGFTVLGGGFEEEQISTPETALRYGADGAAVTVKFGHTREGDFIRQASLVADACEKWNLPFMVEAVAVGEDRRSGDPDGVKLAARAAQEIGADIVKCHYTGDPESFHAVVEGCPAPVVILGGEKTEDLATVFNEVWDSLQAGGAGIAIGRNIWQNADPQAAVEAMVGLVHQGWTVNQALKHCRPGS
jgi:DhnA family fructose-bisphosphate aldolase class Ia